MTNKDEDGVWKTISGRRVFIKNGESLTDAMKNSGKFKKAFDKATKRKGKTATAANPEPPSHAKLRKALENQRKFKKAVDEATKSPTKKSVEALNEIDRLAGDNEYLQKKGRELGLKEFKQFLKDNPGYLKDDQKFRKLEQDFKEKETAYQRAQDKYEHYKWDDNASEDKQKYRAQYEEAKDAYTKASREYGEELAKRSSEAMAREERELKAKYMALPEDKRVSAYEHGENWKDLVKRAYSLDEKETNALHNHLESNIKSWREQGMSDKQILDMVSDRVEVSGDDGLYDIKGLDMGLKKEAILDEYQNYIQSKISTKTKADYDKDLKNINSKAEGTYDLSTGNSKSYQDGYQVTFSMTNMDFDDKTYQGLMEKFKTHDHGTADAGNFDGYSEVSFNVTDIKKAAKLAAKYNQVSIWDWKNGKEILTKGTGKFEDYKPESVSDKVKSQRKEKK